MIQETIIDPTLNKIRHAQRMQIELHIKTNALNEKLNMQISDEEGERIARMMSDPAFGLRIRPSRLPDEDAE